MDRSCSHRTNVDLFTNERQTDPKKSDKTWGYRAIHGGKSLAATKQIHTNI